MNSLGDTKYHEWCTPINTFDESFCNIEGLCRYTNNASTTLSEGLPRREAGRLGARARLSPYELGATSPADYRGCST